MSLQSMMAELRGQVPSLSIAFSKTLVNRAWRTIRERNLWSFLLFEGQWVTPPQFTTGTCTVSQSSNQVTLDATATAALIAALVDQPYSLIGQRQFRITGGGTLSGLYNIWDWDDATGVLSLDRRFGELTGSGLSFTIYQAYYAPCANAGANPLYLSDFKTWISVRDIQHFIDLDCFQIDRATLDAKDPQRLIFQMPTHVVPYQQDQNPDSPTYRQFLYELWGAPLQTYIYQLFGVRRGTDLVNPSDTLPPAVGEDCVIALAKFYAYEYAESQKSATQAVQTGPDYRFLMSAAQKEFDMLFKMYRMQDRETVDSWFSVRRVALAKYRLGYYNTISGTANPGAM